MCPLCSMVHRCTLYMYNRCASVHVHPYMCIAVHCTCASVQQVCICTCASVQQVCICTCASVHVPVVHLYMCICTCASVHVHLSTGVHLYSRCASVHVHLYMCLLCTCMYLLCCMVHHVGNEVESGGKLGLSLSVPRKWASGAFGQESVLCRARCRRGCRTCPMKCRLRE